MVESPCWQCNERVSAVLLMRMQLQPYRRFPLVALVAQADHHNRSGSRCHLPPLLPSPFPSSCTLYPPVCRRLCPTFLQHPLSIPRCLLPCSRLASLLDDFAPAFSAADRVIVTKVSDAMRMMTYRQVPGGTEGM